MTPTVTSSDRPQVFWGLSGSSVTTILRPPPSQGESIQDVNLSVTLETLAAYQRALHTALQNPNESDSTTDTDERD